MKKLSQTPFFVISMFLLALNSSCGGGGGTTGGGKPAVQYGSVEGYVYAPIGSGARVAEATPGYEPVINANVSAVCGSTEKQVNTDSKGYYKLVGLPVGSCTIAINGTGFNEYRASVDVSANQTIQVGGSSGIYLNLLNSGSIRVTSSIIGIELVLDGKRTGISIPSSGVYIFSGIRPGSHTAKAMQPSGYEEVATQSVSVATGQSVDVVFSFNPIGNRQPIANAGPDGTCLMGNRYEKTGMDGDHSLFAKLNIECKLDGSRSSDLDNNALVFRWAQMGGPSVTLTSSLASQPTFIPPQPGNYQFGLSVSDGYLRSSTDTVNVTVLAISGKLVFSMVSRTHDDIATIELSKTNGNGIVRLTHSGGWPRWAPDGRKVVFYDSGIFTMGSDGTGLTKIASDIWTGCPDYSPNGLKIAATCNSLAQICLMNTDGSNQVQISNLDSSNKCFIDWNSDGSKMVYDAYYGGNKNDIFTISSDGKTVLRLTNNGYWNSNPHWTPDGKIIYTFTQDTASGIQGLYIMNSDGTNATKIGNSGANYYTPVMSTDGRFIFYVGGDDYLHVMTFDGKVDVNLGIWGETPDYTPYE